MKLFSKSESLTDPVEPFDHATPYDEFQSRPRYRKVLLLITIVEPTASTNGRPRSSRTAVADPALGVFASLAWTFTPDSVRCAWLAARKTPCRTVMITSVVTGAETLIVPSTLRITAAWSVIVLPDSPSQSGSPTICTRSCRLVTGLADSMTLVITPPARMRIWVGMTVTDRMEGIGAETPLLPESMGTPRVTSWMGSNDGTTDIRPNGAFS